MRAREELEVVWDGRGLLSQADWPPQRWRPDYTFEPSTPDCRPRPVVAVSRSCAHCQRTYTLVGRAQYRAQRFCSRQCAAKAHHWTRRAKGAA